jgi:hypothetical protein
MYFLNILNCQFFKKKKTGIFLINKLWDNAGDTDLQNFRHDPKLMWLISQEDFITFSHHERVQLMCYCYNVWML